MYMRSRTDADRRARERAIATTRTPGGTEAVAALWRSFTSPEHDLRAQAGAISAPTLFIWGRRDPVIPVRGGRRAAALVPGSTLRVLDTGHLPYTTEPGLVADEVRELVREVQAGRMPAGAPLS
jgi:pimeloyl-ACP methyl ester carboxylesterase